MKFIFADLQYVSVLISTTSVQKLRKLELCCVFVHLLFIVRIKSRIRNPQQKTEELECG